MTRPGPAGQRVLGGASAEPSGYGMATFLITGGL